MRENPHPIEQDEVMAYLDGELAVDDAAKAAEHLRQCRECQELAADLQSVSRRMAEWQVAAGDQPMSPANVSALQQLETKVTHNSVSKASGWRKFFALSTLPRLVWAGSGAALALLMVASLTLTRNIVVPANREVVTGRATPAADELARYAAVPTVSEQAQVAKPTDGDRDRLRVLQAQTSSNLEYAARVAEPAPRAGNLSMIDSHATSAATLASAIAPMIARTAQLTIVVKDFDSSQNRLQEILKRHRGYVGEMTTSAPEGADRKLSATLRVPADQMDAALGEVKQLGRVESESQSGEEVTSQYIDLQARLTNARNTEQRLTELLRRQTGKLDEVVTVEEKISDVREQIERMEAEKKTLGQRVDFATLSVSLREERKTQLQVMPPSVGTRFHNAAVEGYRSVVDGLVSLILFLMSWGPSLLLWVALLFFPVRFAWRRLRRIEA